MSVATMRNENPSGSPRPIFAILHPRLAFVKQVYLAVMRYIEADNEPRSDFLIRSCATRDLVRESMINSATSAVLPQPPEGRSISR
jgi:hypothetical protein